MTTLTNPANPESVASNEDRALMEQVSKVCVERAPVDGIDPPEWRKVDGAPGNAVNKDMTALQKHCGWFDRDGDGYVGPMDTYKSFRALGFNPLICLWAVSLINGLLAPPTSGHWYPTFYFNLKNSHRSKHGSDSGIYDETGRFVPAHFDAFFDRYDLDRDGALSWKEYLNRTKAQRHVFDLFGLAATFFEFGFTYWIAGENGKLPKETLRMCYDGSLFEHIENELKAKKQAKKDAKQAKKDAKKNKNKDL